MIKWYLGTYEGLSKEVWILSLVMLINRSGTMVIPFLSVYLTQKLGYTLTETSYVMASFGAGSVLGAYMGGKLTDRFGFYPVMFWALFLSGIGFFFLMLVKTLIAFCVVVFIISSIADAFRPANLTAISVYSKDENRTRSFALVRLAVNLGWTVGPAAGGFFAAHLGYDWLFIADGLTCVSAALLFSLMLRSTTNKREIETSEERALAIPVHKNFSYILFLLSVTLSAIVFMQLISTLPVFLKDYFNMSEDLIGLALALNGAIIVLAEMPLVHTLERRFSALPLIAIGTFMIGFGLLSLNLFGWPVAVISCILLLTFGEIFNMPFTNTYAISNAPETGKGSYLAMLTIAFSLAHVGAPVIGLQIADNWGYHFLWVVLFFFSLVSISLVVVIARKEKQKKMQLAG